ncbi:hypothetical protein BDR22DRAFT_342422 [Usnea florida]
MPASNGVLVEHGSSSLTYPSSSSLDNYNLYGNRSAGSLGEYQPATLNESVENSSWPNSSGDTPSTPILPSSTPILSRAAFASFQYPSSSTSVSNSEAAGSATSASMLSQPPSEGSRSSKLPIPRLSAHVCRICNKLFATPRALRGHQNDEHRFRCERAGCEQVFTNKRGRDRHYKTRAHAAERGADPTYQCRCGVTDARKDNYRRHLKSCKKDSLMPYQCLCRTHTVMEKEEHEAHVKSCKIRKAA